MKGSEAEACELTMQACIPKVNKLRVRCNAETAWEFGGAGLKLSLLDDCRTLEITVSKKRSDVTKDLHTPKYRQRVKPDKKKKPQGQSLEEMLKELEDEV